MRHGDAVAYATGASGATTGAVTVAELADEDELDVSAVACVAARTGAELDDEDELAVDVDAMAFTVAATDS